MPFRNASSILHGQAARIHGRTPGLRKLPLPAIAIIVLLVLSNIVVWIAVGIVLVESHLLQKSNKEEADDPFRVSIRNSDPRMMCFIEGRGLMHL
jgi:hypothetical protein